MSFLILFLLSSLLQNLPQQDVSVPTSQSELSTPANLLPVQSEVLGNPEDRIRHPTLFSSTELPGNSPSKETETKTSLSPRVCPTEGFVVVYDFTREGLVFFIAFVITSSAHRKGLFFESDVESTQPNVYTDLGLDFLHYVGWVDVALVLSLDTSIISVPLVAEVAYQYGRADPYRNRHSNRGPKALQELLRS